MRFLSFFIVVFLMAGAAQAADGEGRLIRPMQAVDSTTLQADTIRILLWGIKPVPGSTAPLQIRTLDFLDELIGNKDVNCKIVSGGGTEVTAFCTTFNNADLGLALLNEGYAIVDRRQTTASAFGPAYMKAQEDARLNARGIWRLVAEEKNTHIPAALQPYMPMLVPLALVAGPLGGVLIAVVMMLFWLRKMTTLQHEAFERTRHKESLLVSREKNVLIATLEGELVENRNKIDAFLHIYRDLLRSLQSEEEVPKYQKAGDIVQKRPFLSKAVFQANVGRLSLLDMKLAGQLSKLYTILSAEQEYINLEPDMSVDVATHIVEKVVSDAESLLPQIDQVIRSLEHAATARHADSVPAAA